MTYPPQPGRSSEPYDWAAEYHSRHQPRGRRIWSWVTLAVVIILGGVAAFVTLYHTGSGSRQTIAQKAHAAKPLTCVQQYAAWHSGDDAMGKKMDTDATALSAEVQAEDVVKMQADGKLLAADAAAMKDTPMPSCADPHGYWGAYLTDVQAAGDDATQVTSPLGVVGLLGPLQQAAADQKKITAELASEGIK